MIQFKVYNDPKIQRFYGFPNYKDPEGLDKTLFILINKYLEAYEKRPVNSLWEARDLYFEYYTVSNFSGWGQLPFIYIYNDMIRHIQSIGSQNNFCYTLESIYVDKDSAYKAYDFVGSGGYIAYEIITAYVAENYTSSYTMMNNSYKGVLLITIPLADDGLISYIISVGFDPFEQSKWFCTNENSYDLGSLPYGRYNSLRSIVNTKLGGLGRASMNPRMDLNIHCEMAESKIYSGRYKCDELIRSFNIEKLKRKSIWDTEVKYGNFPVDWDLLFEYDHSVPGMYYVYTDRFGETFHLNKFNQPDDYRVDYKILKQQNQMIKIDKKKKGLE